MNEETENLEIDSKEEIKEKKLDLTLKVTKKDLFYIIPLLLIYLFGSFGDLFTDFSFLTYNQVKVLTIFIYASTFIFSILFWINKSKVYFKDFKQNFKKYILFILKQFVFSYIALIAASMISILYFHLTFSSENQNEVEKINLPLLLPLACIYAPIVEETIYRILVSLIIKNKYAFIIISGIIFGLAHTIGIELTLFNTFYNSIPYIILGIYIAYIYKKTNNPLCNMTFHFLRNFISIGLMMLI